MTGTELAYRVRDRSLLLPLYKRLVVEPTVRLLPARLAPNVITHTGHVLAFAALAILLVWGATPAGSAACIAAIVLTHLYNWCDNADGAHARRTGQCSAMGELLDHGLDLLNATYIAAMAAIAIGAPPLWTLAIVLVVVGAAAATYWEQAESGMFQLGWLNQIESVFALSVLLAVRAAVGVEVFAVQLGPVPLWLVLAGALCANALFTIAQGLARVWRGRPAAARTFAPLAAFGAAVMAAALTGALSPTAATAIGVAGYVFLGVRHLATRLAKSRPSFEAGVVAVASALLSLALARSLGVHPSAMLDVVFATLAVAFFAHYTLRNTRVALRTVRALDRAR